MAFNSFQEYSLEQLGRVYTVTAKKMFGGVGIYAEGLFFALMNDSALYFKVDDSNRADFEARHATPFRPYGKEGPAMHYYPVPEDVLDDPELLREWATKALAVARAAKRGRKAPEK